MRVCEGSGASPVSPERHLGLGEQLLGDAKRGRAARRVAGAGVGPYYIAFVAGSCLYRAAEARRGCEPEGLEAAGQTLPRVMACSRQRQGGSAEEGERC